MGIKLYDTVKDKNGKRYRVTETKNDGTRHVVATLKGINPDGSARRGMPRKVGLEVLERDYTRINLAPVEVKKIDDLREEESKVTQVPTPSEKALEKQKQAVRALSVDEAETQTARMFGPNDKEWVIPNGPEEQLAALEINLKRLQGDNAILRTEIADLHQENGLLEGELADAKKTISKMQQEHEAEVQDLKDQLGEAKAAEAAAKKAHARAVGEKNDYADALDDDSIAFEAILDLARIAQSVSQSLYKVSKRIEAETEGRI